jgi:hypothetical protein
MTTRRTEAIVRHVWLRTLVAAAVVHASALSAWAQKPTKPPEDDSGVLQWVIAAGIVVVICVTAFLNPKRSHLN